MTSQRIRIQASPPLPSSRIWFLVPQNALNIKDIKQALCQRVAMLKDSSLMGQDLILEIDGFELPDEEPVDLIHENDIVV